MDILVFGGSFDPPHLGHAQLLKAALKALRPDLAYVVPAYRSPLKSRARASAADRLRMTRLMLREELSPAERRVVRLHTYELGRGRATYTYQTLRFLRRLHPGARLIFAAGSDALAGLSSWKRPDELRRACLWAAARRPSARLPAGPGMPRFRMLPGRFADISSHEIRGLLLTGGDPSKLLPRGVLRHIRARGLYGAGIHRRLSRDLAPARYRHTVSVARMAVELARRHGLDSERAALAGLLHDCGRSVAPHRLERYARGRGLRIPLLDEIARQNPILLHAYVSEDLARRRFGVRDKEILGAVRKHTLGDARMSPLDRLIYVADTCSEDRTYPEARLIRSAARGDLSEALRLALAAKLDYALKAGCWIHPLGIALWNSLAGAAR